MGSKRCCTCRYDMRRACGRHSIPFHHIHEEPVEAGFATATECCCSLAFAIVTTRSLVMLHRSNTAVARHTCTCTTMADCSCEADVHTLRSFTQFPMIEHDFLPRLWVAHASNYPVSNRHVPSTVPLGGYTLRDEQPVTFKVMILHFARYTGFIRNISRSPCAPSHSIHLSGCIP